MFRLERIPPCAMQEGIRLHLVFCLPREPAQPRISFAVTSRSNWADR